MFNKDMFRRYYDPFNPLRKLYEDDMSRDYELMSKSLANAYARLNTWIKLKKEQKKEQK